MPPNASSLVAVRPPEVEKKNVCATSPPAITTPARVACDGRVRGVGLGEHAAVDLRADVGEDVVGLARPAAAQRVGARDDGLRLQRLGRPLAGISAGTTP